MNDSQFELVCVDTGKLIVIIAGPNGAGKTTFWKYGGTAAASNLDFLNADEMAADLCPDAPETVAVRAGRILLEQMAEHVATERGFAVETTLSGRAYARAIPRWRAAGFTVRLIFLTLPDADYSIERVAERVRHGGHHIPEADIRRRFDKGLENFYTLYRDLVDEWAIYDNSLQPPRLIESGVASQR